MVNDLLIKDLDMEKWDKRKREDQQNFSKEVPEFLDGWGIKGDYLFPLSLDNIGSTLTHRSVTVFTGESTEKGLFHAMCPELETFVCVTDWLGGAGKRNEKRLKEFQKIKSYVDRGNSQEVCILKGNYRLAKGEYARVLPFKGNITIEPKTRRFYEWERVPFLKRSGEVFYSFASPIFMIPLRSEEKGVAENLMYYFTTLFIPLRIEQGTLVIDVFQNTRGFMTRVPRIRYGNETLHSMQFNSKIYQGLFADVIHGKERYIRLVEISQAAIDGNDLVGHMVAQRLYYTYLSKGKLYLCTNEELRRFVQKFARLVHRDYNLQLTMPFKSFIFQYLNNYFFFSKDKCWYLPFILQHIGSEELIGFLEAEERGESMFDSNNSHFDPLRKLNYTVQFIKRYNKYAKRTLINDINRYRENKVVDPWRIE